MAKTNCTFRFTFKTYGIILFNLVLLSSCVRQNSKLPNWLLGKWEANVNGIRVVETWNLKNNHFNAETRTFYEQNPQLEKVLLELNDDSLYYNISINNRKTCFVCGTPLNDTLIFVNNLNEFPKRIVYTKPENDKMKVWIDNFQGDPNRIDYWFQKIN